MAMRVWLYARLSNDDDPAQNSLQNQQEICRAFAEKKGWSIAAFERISVSKTTNSAPNIANVANRA